MTISISVITCTYNPKKDFLKQVLHSLRCQTLSTEKWEYLLIDNASDQPVASQVSLDWHSNVRHIREDELGLTAARLRGIREASTNLIVFVDDDNVLEPTYLENALHIAENFPFIGAWGGVITGEYELSPPEWAEEYLPMLGIREFDRDRWSNLANQYETAPCGAGMCIRKEVAEKYAQLVKESVQRRMLDRRGNALSSSGDSDLAFTACDIGLGVGLFTKLKLTHLIPAERLKKEYLLRLVEGMSYSHSVLFALRQQPTHQSKMTWRSKLKEYLSLAKRDSIQREFYRADRRGFYKASKVIEEMKQNKGYLHSR